jgi:hypothetical protein
MRHLKIGSGAGKTRAVLALTLGLVLVACGGQTPAAQNMAAQNTAAQNTAVPDVEAQAEQSGEVTTLEALQLGAGNNTLSFEPFTSVTNGWGPVERDRSNGEKAEGDGRPLTLNGQTYARGFGTHADSSLSFDLGGRCQTFTARVGVDDEVGERGSVVFQVYADGVKLYDSGRMTGQSATRAVEVPVAGTRELKLVVTDAGDGLSADHADWVNPLLLSCTAPAPAPVPVTVRAPTPAPVTYSGPVTITRGGTYSGNWENTGRGAAVVIQTTEPVIIENARLRSRGTLVTGFGIDLTLRNVQGESLTPNEAGKAAEMAIKAEEFRNLRVENSSFTGGGIYVRKFVGDPARGQSVRILRNTFTNIDGRQSDGAGGHNGKTSIRQAVQFNNVTRIEGAEIAWNQVINEPGQSAVEDNINLYVSSGTPGSPIQIHNNYVQGGYPVDLSSARYSGGGILLGDGKSTDPASNGYQSASDNIVVGTTNYGVAIIGGYGNRLERNRAVSSGRLPDGRRVAAQNVGLYVWDMYGSGSAFGMNRMEGNVSGWTQVGQDGKTKNNPMWTPHCKTNGTRCKSNANLGTVSLAAERAEWTRWQQKLAGAGIQVGAR